MVLKLIFLPLFSFRRFITRKATITMMASGAIARATTMGTTIAAVVLICDELLAEEISNHKNGDYTGPQIHPRYACNM